MIKCNGELTTEKTEDGMSRSEEKKIEKKTEGI
jgi:hypothetical protein